MRAVSGALPAPRRFAVTAGPFRRPRYRPVSRPVSRRRPWTLLVLAPLVAVAVMAEARVREADSSRLRFPAVEAPAELAGHPWARRMPGIGFRPPPGWRVEPIGVECSERSWRMALTRVDAMDTVEPEAPSSPSVRIAALLARYRHRREEPAPPPIRTSSAKPLQCRAAAICLGSSRRALAVLRQRHSEEEEQSLGSCAVYAGAPAAGGSWVELAAGRYVVGLRSAGGRPEEMGRLAQELVDANSEMLLPERESGERHARQAQPGRSTQATVETEPSVEPTRWSQGRRSGTRSPGRRRSRRRARIETAVAVQQANPAASAASAPAPARIPGALAVSETPQLRSRPEVPGPDGATPVRATAPPVAPGRSPSRGLALYEAGRQYLAMERPEDALRSFAAALTADPSIREARERMREVEQRFGLTAEAAGVAAPPEATEPEAPLSIEPARPAPPVPPVPPVPPPAPPRIVAPPPPQPVPVAPPEPLTPVVERPAPPVPPAASPPAPRRPVRSRTGPLLPLAMGGVFACLMFVLLKKRLRV
ncbi:MAG: hypothetical protein HY303_12895 [Candidatus Wallbacteria bacterium]|nr:hypothetical protein [Candidatus Wallbacteria bacterium]